MVKLVGELDAIVCRTDLGSKWVVPKDVAKHVTIHRPAPCDKELHRAKCQQCPGLASWK